MTVVGLGPVEAGSAAYGRPGGGHAAADAPSVTITELAPLPDSEPGTVAVPYDINDRGEIVGASQLGRSSPFLPGSPEMLTATRWRDDDLAPTPVGGAGGGTAPTVATHVNDRGQVALDTRGDDGVWTAAALWFRGRLTALPADLGRVRALNDRGQVLMSRSGTPLVPGAVGVWQDGVVHRVTPPDGATVVDVRPHSLSDRGHVAVSFGTGPAPGSPWFPWFPRYDLGAFLWHRGTLTRLGTQAAALAVNDAGTVVGTGSPDALAYDGVVWDGARATVLPWFSPVDVNDRGQVVGVIYTEEGRRAGLWHRGRLVDLGTLGGSWSIPFAINDRGQVVARSPIDDGDQEDHLVVWTSGQWVDLGRWAGVAYPGGPDINDRGQVVGVIEEEAPDGTTVARGILAEIHDPALDQR